MQSVMTSEKCSAHLHRTFIGTRELYCAAAFSYLGGNCLCVFSELKLAYATSACVLSALVRISSTWFDSSLEILFSLL